MHVIILGTSAGGGLPQWNCNCENCRAVRQGRQNIQSRNQPSVALSMDGENWHLLNVCPDIRQQIMSTPALHPQGDEIRHTPIKSAILTNADIDHSLGLLIMRESTAYHVYSTTWIKEALVGSNTLFQLLERPPEPVQWNSIQLEVPFFPAGEKNLQITPFPVPGKVPTFLQKHYQNSPEATIGLNIQDINSQQTLVYLPGVQEFSEKVWEQINQAQVLLIDGTMFSNTEMQDLGIATAPTAKVMGHWPVADEDGTIALLQEKTDLRKIFIHINNTNPMLREDSPQAKIIQNAGWEISYDGLEITL